MATKQSEVVPGTVLTRNGIMPIFGGGKYGGICPAVAERNVVLYSDEEAGAKFGYKDGWLAEEDEHGKVFEYTAAGTKGDQTFGGRYGGTTQRCSDMPNRAAPCGSSLQ
jgi:5-methylcytosine-specific restriction protein A